MNMDQIEDIPDIDAWQPWTPQLLAKKLQDISQHWYVAGGWALDLHLGQLSRDHEDLEFCVFRQDLQTFQDALTELAFYSAHNGELHPLETDS